MKGIVTIAIFWLVCTPLAAQWNDNFSDNDFTSNPEWVGNGFDFIIENEVLRLNAPAVSADSYLSTPSDISLQAEWNFFIKLDFNPSSSNYVVVYLMADSENLNNVQNGYFIKIGGTPDEVSLYNVSGGSESLLIDGTDGRVGLSSVEVFVRVTREENGDWDLKTKLTGETNFVSEGTANDLTIKKSSHFGIYCKYTSTRSTKFYMDDITVTGNPYVDPDPPVLLSTSTPLNNAIKLIFNEAIDPLEAVNLTHYVLNNSINPIAVETISPDTFVLNFTSDLELINTLEIKSLPDLVGNELDTIVQVLFIDPSPYSYRDLIINEIFPDPSPQEDLPPFEFVELLNLSDRIIDLDGWHFADKSKFAEFTNHLIYPDSFLIICSNEAKAEYLLFGETVGTSIWPTLNNDGDALKLTDKNGVLIDSLTYSLDWYNDNSKDNGGWSLEQINPFSKCQGIFNWTASNSTTGGSPGKPNSNYSINTDFEAPEITQALVSDSLLEVWFSELVLPNTYVASILPGNLNAIIEINSPAKYSSVKLSSQLNVANLYTIKIPLEDCDGNKGTSVAILIPIAVPQIGDLIINELLFDPFSGGSDFVEVANTTMNYFNLKGFSIANETSSYLISDTTLLLKPIHFLAVSEDIVFLKNQYLAPDSSLHEADLPSMPNDEGVVLLKTNLGETIDSVNYSSSYHFSLISDVEGISLERISPKEESTTKDNWRSAAQTVGFATPGYVNSQSKTPSKEGKITVYPEILTPNNDGQADFCQVLFALDEQSQAITIRVYNINGQLVKTIASNAIIPPEGFFTWDGTDQQGGVLPTAHYIIISEVITSDGRTLTFRNKVVVANGF